MGFNRIILEGRLTKDVELRYTQGNTASAKSSIAVSKNFTQNGEKKEKTLFVNLQFWGRSAEIFNQYCRKGSHILIEGELENNNWIDGQGNKKYDFFVNVSSMQMLDTKGSSQSAPADDNMPPYREEAVATRYGEPEQKNAYYRDYDGKPDNSHTAYRDPERKQVPDKNALPSIDIDEEEIPF